MKKISKSDWKRYKDSDGKEVIALFDKILTNEFTHEEMIKLAEKYDPQFFSNIGTKDKAGMLEELDIFENMVGDVVDALGGDDKIDNYEGFYAVLTTILLTDDESITFHDLPQAAFKNILSANILLSIILSAYLPNFFLPNFYEMQFIYLKRLADKYDLELPKVPNRSDYRERWMYYYDMCSILNAFFVENEINSFGEACAFLYDYEMTHIKEEMEEEVKTMPDVPEQAWILVGTYGQGERNMKKGFWQANQLTCKGDIMLFYEKYPVKKMNSVWIAQEDGVVDPFFHYYSNTYIGNKIEIPAEQALTFEDFRNSEYFQKRDSKGNYVSKRFQDVSGWQVTTEDYAEIKRMLEAKGFDTSVLPSLYEPKKLVGVNIELESDVSNQLLVPLLEEMGWKKDIDFKAEVEFKAGRGSTGHSMKKRPDFCLHLKGEKESIEAKVVIEVKLFMKNNDEIESNYKQGLSYAKWGNAQVLVLCDKAQIRVYLRDKHNNFDINKYIRYRWEDMQNLEKYNELKRLLE